MRYKADWFFENLTSIDLTTLQDSGAVVIGDAAFEVSDYNSDGVADLRYYSPDPMGRQVLYGLSD